MSNPTDLPGRSVPVMTLPEAPLPDVVAARELDFGARMAAIRDNELGYEVTVNILGLPSAEYVVDADAVRVTSADIGVLAAWLDVKGGTVTKVDTGFGVIVWTLVTNAGADEDRIGCRVLVTVPVAESGWVPCEVSAKAVTA